eukprot:TRINITY_DN622_c0_g1_i1.p1 TRINITY_DN622_c0_g1~~TRINITY_DN622_c0_g1_i1.p1  ORF type:complete len:164 (-),score=67.66 TRINITY_DN622_c0_g1_i1:228-719(-)
MGRSKKNGFDVDDFTEEQMAEFHTAFNLFDKDGDGTISQDELKHVLKTLGQNPSKKEVMAMMKEIDVDRSGSIDFPEFVNMMAKKMGNVDESRLIEDAFKVFDKDGDGILQRSELRKVMENLGEAVTEKQLERMVREADFDGDGEISKEDFIKIMKKQAKARA